MGWLIDPKEQSVFVYLGDRPTMIYDKLETRLPVPAFAKELNLTSRDLFSWLTE